MNHSSQPRGRSRPRVESSFDFENSDFHSSRRDKAARKTQQLCRQAFRTLSLALSACGDEIVQGLNVLSVDPLPDAGRLRVTVGLGLNGHSVAPLEILERLQRVQGRLRADVARAISRKRAPELVFQVASGTEERP